MFIDASTAPARTAHLSPRRPARALLALALPLCLLTGFGWGAADFVRDVRRMPSLEAPQADGVVALTGGPDRIAGATALLAGGKAGRMLISGVHEKTTRTELAREHPRYGAIVECCVDIGYAAENTQGNAVETARWSRRHGLRRLIVVTADYHMPRALAELRGVIPEAVLLPYPVRTARLQPRSWWRDGEALRLVTMEYVKYLRTLARNALAPQQGAALAGGARRFG